MEWIKHNWIKVLPVLAILVTATILLSGSSPTRKVTTEEGVDADKLAAAIKYAEAQREDKAANSVIEARSEEELFGNPYIQHIRTALNGYLDGTNDGIEEGTAEAFELESGYMCGLNSFDRSYYRSNFSIAKVRKNDYGGIEAYIAFDDRPDALFWVWVYPYGDGEYTLRGFCQYSSLIEQ